jgi:predicted DNA-binding transcriptional regulator YafY
MSKRESITRYNLIIKKLRNAPASFEEILHYLKIESDIQSYDFVVSKRTFQRDLEDIRSIYNIDIRYSTGEGKYYIANRDDEQGITDRILEAFDVFNALNITDRLSGYIHFNKRRALGTEHLYGILHAIRNKRQITFTYEKFLDGNISKRSVEPYALKESRHRWYVLAYDLRDKIFKSFGLDRISELDITRRPFANPVKFDVDEYYRYCYGIISAGNKKPQEIVLEFEHVQGKYIKSLPLHETQRIISETPKTLTVGITIVITYDFVMELLSFGKDVKVIKPRKLADRLCEIYQSALDLYR